MTAVFDGPSPVAYDELLEPLPCVDWAEFEAGLIKHVGLDPKAVYVEPVVAEWVHEDAPLKPATQQPTLKNLGPSNHNPATVWSGFVQQTWAGPPAQKWHWSDAEPATEHVTFTASNVTISMGSAPCSYTVIRLSDGSAVTRRLQRPGSVRVSALLLATAAMLIEEHGWFQGDLWPRAIDSDRRTKSWTKGTRLCAYGAVLVAANITKLGQQDSAASMLWDEFGVMDGLMGFNDAFGRTQAEVVRELRRRAQRLADIDDEVYA